MKWTFVLLFFVCAAQANAQGHFSIHAEGQYMDSLRFGWGGGVMYSYTVDNKFTFGAGATLLKFKTPNKPYIPIFAHTSFHPISFGPITPLIFMEGGKAVYKETSSSSYSGYHFNYVYTANTYLFGGLGLRLKLPSFEPTLLLGRSGIATSQTFTTSNSLGEFTEVRKAFCNGWGARLSIRLK
jgi:hypothetical protein